MVWETASIIKLVAGMNITAICAVASNISKHYTPEDIEQIDNHCIYEAYCKYGGVKSGTQIHN